MIPLPQKLKVILEEGSRGVYEIEGLYPGYGHTLGNSMRRVLLSSLKGTVITSVKIEGVSHEFSTIPGVQEDIVDLVLNFKQVRFRMHGEGSYTVHLDVKGEYEVRASDFVIPSQLELVTPDLYIANLTDKKASLKIDAEVESGLGYQSVDSRKKDKVEIGSIALDASFSPVRSVNYEVENMRVGDRTDYNRLRLHLATDGSLSPREALRDAVSILIEQFQELGKLFTGEGERDLPQGADMSGMPEAEETEDGQDDVMKKRIEDLELSTRTQNALLSGGVKNVGALVRKTEKKLKEIEGMGDKGIQEVKKALANLGFTLKQ